MLSSPSEVPPQMRYLEEMGIKFLRTTPSAIPIPECCDIIREEDREKGRMLRQAKLAHRLKSETAHRLLGEDQSKIAAGEKFVSPVAACRDMSNAILMQKSLYPPKHENHWVLQLPNVFFQGETLGTLEACGSGFTFTAPGIHVHFKDTSIEQSFYFKDTSIFVFEDSSYGYNNPIPVLQFHLRDPAVVETRETTLTAETRETTVMAETRETNKDIMFGLMSFGDPVKELDNFVNSVAWAQWDSHCMLPPFQELTNCTFKGVLPSGSTKFFALTFRALVLLVKLPCTVIPLTDIEIVNLELVSVGIDMTVVFKDFKREVLQINSINLRMLPFIKDCLDLGNVKYYCRSYHSSLKIDWNSKLREILKCPKKFVESGGWESLDLEDPLTLSYYNKVAGEPEVWGVFA